MPSNSRWKFLIVLGSVAVAPVMAGAQNLDSLRKMYSLPVPTFEKRPYRVTPGTTAQSPNAYGVDWGEGFIGAGYTNRMRYTKDLPRSKQRDGAVYAGLGFGDSRKYVGLETVVTSYSTVRSGLGNHSSLSFMVHRSVYPNVAVALGWEDALHTKGTDGGNSIYGVASTAYKRLTFSAGLGNGRFQTERAWGEGKNGVNVFGSASYRVAPPISFIADWAGQDLALATSIVPFSRVPIYIMPGFADVTGSAGDGARFILGVGLGFTYRQLDDIFGTH